jgi:hypothetical protein
MAAASPPEPTPSVSTIRRVSAHRAALILSVRRSRQGGVKSGSQLATVPRAKPVPPTLWKKESRAKS